MNEPYRIPEALQQSSDDILDEHVRRLRRDNPTCVYDSCGRLVKDRAAGCVPREIGPDGKVEVRT